MIGDWNAKVGSQEIPGMHAHAQLLQSCPTLCDTVDCSLPGSSVHEESPNKNTGVGCHELLQGIFPTQGWNPSLLCLLNWQAGSLPLGPAGKPEETPGVTGKFGLGIQNEAGQTLIEFCQENVLVIENTLFQQHKR